MKIIIISTLYLLSSVLFVSCDNSKEVGFGSPCDENTVCQGICNLGLPSGMCTEECSDENPCKTGVCTSFSEHSYCLPTCEKNEDCRENYGCINFKCAPLQPLGAECDDDFDCLQTFENQSITDVKCQENVCSIPCSDQSECTDGTVCALTDDNEYWCIGIYFQQGPGTAGENCSTEDCNNGFECFDDPNSEILPYCTNICVTQRDCPPDMTCRGTGIDDNKYCVLRTFCEECDLDSQCGFKQDKCVGYINENTEISRFCSMQCDPMLEETCPSDATCKSAKWCDEPASWIDDCTKCQGNCSEPDTTVYQCFKDYGNCLGEGNRCEPCHIDSDCQEGFYCKAISDNNKVCVEKCDINNICPDGYMCNQLGEQQYCIPRTLSCTHPSENKETCDICTKWSDCLRGGCLNLPNDSGGIKKCLDFCTDSSDCGYYATCETVVSDNGDNYKVCIPSVSVDTCENWQECNNLCPNGPSSCSNPPDYCQ